MADGAGFGDYIGGMNDCDPVFTEKTKCQDCYKCVRNCPVKAIKVADGSAAVVAEECVACGRCVEVCPVGAKKVRDDVGRVRELLRRKGTVVVSLAPSHVTEFAGVPAGVLITALKRLGFGGVSETALGAQEVSATVAGLLQDKTPRVLISSACPTVVDLLRKHLPHYFPALTQLCSPLLAHCRILRERLGKDIGVVFIGPCIAKKKEADQHPELLDAALTFEELRRWFAEEGIELEQVAAEPAAAFIPEKAHEGCLYPVDGGMVAGIQANCRIHDAGLMAFSGIAAIEKALKELDGAPLRRPLFLELLACEGGCVNGPRVSRPGAGTAVKRVRVIEHADYPGGELPRTPRVNASLPILLSPVVRREPNEREIREALRLVGKVTREDELNCGGCGYENCREFARALLEGKAERTMCVSYMRKLAQNKAAAVMKTMPSGVVIVDENLKVVECNELFARLLGEDALAVYAARPGLEGAAMEKLAPFAAPLFRSVLETGNDLPDRDLRDGWAVFHLSIFTIEPHRMVGGILQDITKPAVYKQQVVRKAREVIRKNLATVQKIAYLLGENAAESEVILNSIIDSFAPETGRGGEADAPADAMQIPAAAPRPRKRKPAPPSKGAR